MRIEYDLPEDDVQVNEAMAGWTALMAERASNAVFLLTNAILDALVAEGFIVSEKDRSIAGEGGIGPTTPTIPSALPKGKLKRYPPSSLPASQFKPIHKLGRGVGRGAAAVVLSPLTASPAVSAVTTLVMQIKPHKNGEIFLSKLAVDQNPLFFGFPFTGSTVPKKAANPTYPQRVPDPVVSILVYGSRGSTMLTLNRFALNTVFYEAKSEIRVTCSQLVPVAPEYSVMVMRFGAPGSGLDYEIEIFRPDSPDYATWLACCNQSMPSGGKKQRLFGWL